MKKHLSVFALIARSSIFKLLILFVLLAGVEGIVFYLKLKNELMVASELGMQLVGVEYVFSSGRVFWIAALIFLLMTAQLCVVGCNFGSRQSYTLNRLLISEKSVFIWQSVFNIISYVMLWAVQLGIALALCRWYMNVAGETSGQAVMLAFYRNKFLHSLLPLSDITRLIRNVLMMFALSVTAARFVWANHRGQLGVGIIAMTALVLVFFAGETSVQNTDYLMSFCSAAVAFECLYSVLIKEADHEED